MSNIVLAWPDQVPTATLTSPQAWNTALPLANLADPVLGHVAKINATSATINIGFSKFTQMGVVALDNHNLSVSATVRIYVYYDAAQTQLLYDSGDIAVWPSVFNSLDLAWEDANFWDGTPTNDQRALFTALFKRFFPGNYACMSIKLVISDPSNLDGYLKIGQLFIAPYFIPTLNTSYNGFERSPITTTQVSDCKGTLFFNRRKTKRRQSINLEWLTESEALQRIYTMQIQQGIDKDILYADSLDENQYSILTTILGTLENLNPLTQPNFGLHGAKINILEKI